MSSFRFSFRGKEENPSTPTPQWVRDNRKTPSATTCARMSLVLACIEMLSMFQRIFLFSTEAQLKTPDKIKSIITLFHTLLPRLRSGFDKQCFSRRVQYLTIEALQTRCDEEFPSLHSIDSNIYYCCREARQGRFVVHLLIQVRRGGIR